MGRDEQAPTDGFNAHGVVMRDWTVIQTVQEFQSGEGQYAVVRYADDTYGITVNGEPLRPFVWHAGQLEDCIFMTSRLAQASPVRTAHAVHAA